MARTFPMVLVLLALAACSDSGVSNCTSDCMTVHGEGPTINGSGTLKTESRPVGKFTTVKLSGVGARATIAQTGAESLEVTADDNLLSLFTSEVRDGTLYLSVVKGKSIAGKQPVYKITVSDLREIDLGGSGEIEATKLDGAALSMSVSGSGSARLAGRTDDLTISVSGSGSCNAAELKAKRAKVVVSGSGDLTVNASDELDAKVSGSGSIRYIGSPKLTTNISGSGTIKQKPM
jgi:hypothetical protein